VQLFCREQGEPWPIRSQIKSRLRAED
jgi:hypothetical protein